MIAITDGKSGFIAFTAINLIWNPSHPAHAGCACWQDGFTLQDYQVLHAFTLEFDISGRGKT
jgi:hypothetical protein